MEPEIARRCTECGASVRGGSAFCPQCGRALVAGASQVRPAAEAPETPVRRATDTGRDASTVAPPARATDAASGLSPVQEMLASDEIGEGSQRSKIASAPLARPADVRSKRHRVRTAARDAVEEKLAPRVEKLRHASNVMLEEASYDPSLRFVLVAIGLLLLFLLLLLLNYLIG